MAFSTITKLNIVDCFRYCLLSPTTTSPLLKYSEDATHIQSISTFWKIIVGVLDGKSELGEKNRDGEKVNVNSYSLLSTFNYINYETD